MSANHYILGFFIACFVLLLLIGGQVVSLVNMPVCDLCEQEYGQVCAPRYNPYEEIIIDVGGEDEQETIV